jgi:UDP-glucuronate 4-epimerase
MHVLVTGGAGFIGSHFVDRLLRDGHRVTALDNFDPFYDRAMKERNIQQHARSGRWRLVECDLRDADGLRRLLPRDIDAIAHLAAKVGVRASVLDPIACQEVNVAGTHNLLELAREWRVQQFVFASSSSVYGVNPRLPWSESDQVLRPISPYASTKISGELLGHVYSHLHGIRFIALRLFTVYGPRQRPDLAIHKFAREMTAGRPVTVYGDGTSRRDHTFVEDIVNGLRAALDYTASDYEIINLGTNHAITVLELIRGLESVLGLEAALNWLPEQAGDVPQTCANIEKAKRLLAYEPRTDYLTGLRRFVEWLQTDVAASTP